MSFAATMERCNFKTDGVRRRGLDSAGSTATGQPVEAAQLCNDGSASYCSNSSPISSVASDTIRCAWGGGFFYNTHFKTLIRTSGIFENVFVPIVANLVRVEPGD